MAKKDKPEKKIKPAIPPAFDLANSGHRIERACTLIIEMLREQSKQLRALSERTEKGFHDAAVSSEAIVVAIAQNASAIAANTATLAEILELVKPSPIVGIEAFFESYPRGENMASFKVSLVKKGAKAKFGAVASDFTIQDNEDGTFTVLGKDAAGFGGIDISGVATLTVSSDNAAVLTVGVISGMTFPVSAVAPGTCNLTITATWNDGSIGPFVINLPGTVTQGPVTGLEVDVGTPTPRP
jgi:hypothetical protein